MIQLGIQYIKQGFVSYGSFALRQMMLNICSQFHDEILNGFNSFGAKFQMTFVISFFFFYKLLLGKKFIFKV